MQTVFYRVYQGMEIGQALCCYLYTCLYRQVPSYHVITNTSKGINEYMQCTFILMRKERIYNCKDLQSVPRMVKALYYLFYQQSVNVNNTNTSANFVLPYMTNLKGASLYLIYFL